MKNLLISLGILLLTSTLYGQQLPISENYFVDRYSLSSAYAGNSENKSLFASYRRDWSGVTDGPRTIRLSYHDGFKSKAGLGAKLILDKFGIFQSLYAMGSYSYRLQLVNDHFLFFGLSAGIHQNSINFSDYYNDPNFTTDPSMINKDVKSKMKFVSDFAIVYSWNRLQTGILFSNISYSDAKYTEVKTTYSPFVHYQVHANYTFQVNDLWKINPLIIYRLGENVGSQLEIASQFLYHERVWANAAHRGKNIYCLGFGMNAGKGIVLNYNFNFFTGVSVKGFNNHELTVGLKLGEFFPKKDDSESE